MTATRWMTTSASADAWRHDHDVWLGVVSGALRTWLLTRGEAIVPSSHDPADWCRSACGPITRRLIGNRLSSYFVDLPVGSRAR